MTVTNLSEISKSRIKVEIDGEFAFVLYKGELRTYGVREGEELTQESYETLMQEILPRRAKLRVLNLLKSRSYTRAQLAEKLTVGGYRAEHVKIAIDYAASFGYVDDRQYTRDYIEYNKEKKSRQRILTDLIHKGIPKQLFEEIWSETVGGECVELEKEQIKSWILKKEFAADEASPEEMRKMTAFLYRKGFSFDSIRSVLSLDITSI